MSKEYHEHCKVCNPQSEEAWQGELMEQLGIADHSHCFYGQKSEHEKHLACCLCGKKNPDRVKPVKNPDELLEDTPESCKDCYKIRNSEHGNRWAVCPKHLKEITPELPEDWIERFNVEFTATSLTDNPKLYLMVQDFIKSLLAQAKKEERERIEKHIDDFFICSEKDVKGRVRAEALKSNINNY